ncbi:unnamed protein product [Linum trigynum]|uniref:Uncharacterized protein n=1 Tax=Linum trigynum TaxID=586398 RepID=A0AAV2EEX1_9ROSI
MRVSEERNKITNLAFYISSFLHSSATFEPLQTQNDRRRHPSCNWCAFEDNHLQPRRHNHQQQWTAKSSADEMSVEAEGNPSKLPSAKKGRSSWSSILQSRSEFSNRRREAAKDDGKRVRIQREKASSYEIHESEEEGNQIEG